MSPHASSRPALPESPLAHTKIVATIGPASESRLSELLAAGMSVARMNFSHGEHADHARRIAGVRAAAREAGRAVCILADLPGPKMRLGRIEGGARELAPDAAVRLVQSDGVAPEGEVYLSFGGFYEALEPGHRVILADGQAQLVVESKEGAVVFTRVVRPGLIADRKGVHMPDSPIHYELPTQEDIRHIEFCKTQDVDMLGLSFVGHPSEVERIRGLAPGLAIVSKIERRVAIEHLDGILAASDGIMVARGDLGVELMLEKVPLAQKHMLERASLAGRFTITATEMLESMVHSSRPTRAEVADVANAVLDGTDAIMLSAESAVGEHPVEAVRTMNRIASEVEASPRYGHTPRPTRCELDQDFSRAIAKAAVDSTWALGVDQIVCFTESGRTAQQLAAFRPRVRILALSPSERVVHQMAVLSHVQPLQMSREESLEGMLSTASSMLIERGLGTAGQTIAFVAGVPPGTSRSTNVLKLHTLGEKTHFA